MTLALTKVPPSRILVASGAWYRIYYAMRRDGTIPAKEVMEHLEDGTWSRGENAGLEADEQVDAYARLLYRMEYYAEHGMGPEPESMNVLDPGIFEFKAGRARIYFYDTPGDGTHQPRGRIHYIDDADFADSPTWHVPDLDEEIRLCSGWPKEHRLAKPSTIAETRQIRCEDLAHDKE